MTQDAMTTLSLAGRPFAVEPLGDHTVRLRPIGGDPALGGIDAVIRDVQLALGDNDAFGFVIGSRATGPADAVPAVDIFDFLEEATSAMTVRYREDAAFRDGLKAHWREDTLKAVRARMGEIQGQIRVLGDELSQLKAAEADLLRDGTPIS